MCSSFLHIRNNLFNFMSDVFLINGDINFKSVKSFLLHKPCYSTDLLRSTVSTDNYGAKAKRFT